MPGWGLQSYVPGASPPAAGIWDYYAGIGGGSLPLGPCSSAPDQTGITGAATAALGEEPIIALVGGKRAFTFDGTTVQRFSTPALTALSAFNSLTLICVVTLNTTQGGMVMGGNHFDPASFGAVLTDVGSGNVHAQGYNGLNEWETSSNIVGASLQVIAWRWLRGATIPPAVSTMLANGAVVPSGFVASGGDPSGLWGAGVATIGASVFGGGVPLFKGALFTCFGAPGYYTDAQVAAKGAELLARP